MSDTDLSNTGSRSRIVDFLSGAWLTVALFAFAIALLFFATLDEARYGLGIATRAYFGSLVAIWQYPADWPAGGVLYRFWLPLPGAPVVAFGFVVSLVCRGWRNLRGASWTWGRVSVGTAHVGVMITLAGYALLLGGSFLAKAFVIAGASVCVVGMAILFGRDFLEFVRQTERGSASVEGMSGARRRVSAHWFYAAVLGAAAGACLCSLSSRGDLIQMFSEKKVELLPVFFYLLSVFASYIAWMRGEAGGSIQRGFAGPLLSAGVAVHTLAVVVMSWIRMLPPVFDLYSTFVFAGWCGVIVAYYAERRLKNGVAGVAAAFVGSACLAVAYGMGHSFDAGVPPVVASGVWLSLHVVTIVFGYGAVLLTVVVANILLVGRKCGLSQAADTILTRLMNGAFGAGFVFVALGILMGGIWAESAWGRFWGWDPKENAALMLLFWCALVVHAKRGGVVQEGGYAALVAWSGIILGWSWVGVNLMGEGLHSYSLATTGAWGLVIYALAQFVVIAAFRPRWRQQRR